MRRSLIMILEDDAERIRSFQHTIAPLGFRLHHWHDAPAMIAECLPYLADTCLISLDHDLHRRPSATRSPGSGLEVAKFLARHPAVCPVIIHTGSSDSAWSMYRVFQGGNWNVEMVPPLGKGWIHRSWLPAAKALIHRRDG
jgi:FixJ family two-component response regulator